MLVSLLPVDGSVLLQDFVDAYLHSRANQLKSIKDVKSCLRRFCCAFPTKNVSQLRRADVSDYISRRQREGRAPKTINVELLHLSAAINFARDKWGWQIDNPVRRQYLREPEGRLRYLTRDEAERLILHASTRPGALSGILPDFIRLALHTGMRKTELLTLTWRQVDFSLQRITLEPEVTKNCRRRIVPLNTRALGALRSRQAFNKHQGVSVPWVFARPSGKRVVSIYKGFCSARDSAGIENFRIHDLRHTFASWLVLSGVPLLQVRDLLGHSSIKMTERYAHLSQDALARAVAVLETI